ncbi:MAG: hypothetical protein ACJZ6A_04260 [Candidatus Poseidoniaceae archaeon]
MKWWRASSIAALAILGVGMVFGIILDRNNMNYSDDPIIEQIYTTLGCLGIAIYFSLEGRHHLQNHTTRQQSLKSKVLWLYALLCIAIASSMWFATLAWLFGLGGPA